jgi:CDGSH-type Zn-finger protein/uncharacterized Fe-S cluster protein YjdI
MTRKSYAGKDIVITYDAARCIHAGECVRGAPLVFDPTAKPWIAPDGADAETIAAVVARCPTGALTVTRPDGSAVEVPDTHASATLQADGPIYLRGRITYSGGTHAALVEYARVALCRCGASANKPFCDGSHSKVGFVDAGACALAQARAEADDAAAAGVVKLSPIANGPLMVEGRIEFRSADGGTFVSEEKTWLCRCGRSANKPFCDGSHKKIGFTA